MDKVLLEVPPCLELTWHCSDTPLHSAHAPAAVGAVAIAAVGVYGVFKMAVWVSREAGQPINKAEQQQQQQQQQRQQQAGGGGGVDAASPLEPLMCQVRAGRSVAHASAVAASEPAVCFLPCRRVAAICRWQQRQQRPCPDCDKCSVG